MSGRAPILAALDGEDLQVISARLQDAVARLGDLVYLPKKRRFVALFNRFKWESGKRENLRVRAGLHFDGVLSVKSQNLKMGAPEAVISLLAGDIYGRTPIWRALTLFKFVYAAASLANLKRTLVAWRRRRLNIRDVGPLAGETVLEAR